MALPKADAAVSRVRLEARDIVKHFGSLTALSQVGLAVRSGTVHALLGENGAGKSTLLQILAGRLTPDAGSLWLDGEPVRWQQASQARHAGIGFVPQHLSIVPNLSAVENTWLGLGPGTSIWQAHLALRTYAPGIAPDVQAATLSLAERQAIEFARVLASHASILLLDEPTAVLSPPEVDVFMQRLAELRAAGKAIVIVTHKLGEVESIADEVTVLRQGRIRLSAQPPFDRSALVRAAVGEWEKVVPHASGPTVLGKTVAHWVGKLRSNAPECAIRLHGGEIFCVVGVDGNGQTELAEALLGLAQNRTTCLEVAKPVALIPGDRHHQGLIASWSAANNLVLRHETAVAPSLWLRPNTICLRAREAMAAFDVRPADPTLPVAVFSGGNQQKIVLARELHWEPAAWILAVNPTRGLDFRATAMLHQALLATRQRGAGVLLITADLDEALALGDRHAVLYRHQLQAVPPGAGRHEIGHMMMGSTP